MPVSDDGIRNLQAAILRQAAADYIDAYRCRRWREVDEIESWLVDGFGQCIAEGTGSRIVSECRNKIGTEEENPVFVLYADGFGKEREIQERMDYLLLHRGRVKVTIERIEEKE